MDLKPRVQLQPWLTENTVTLALIPELTQGVNQGLMRLLKISAKQIKYYEEAMYIQNSSIYVYYVFII